MFEQGLYKKIDAKISSKINILLESTYEQAALGTIDKNQLPLVTKVVPLVIQNKIYMLLSDLSEHTQNITDNPAASLYFASPENHKTRSNNIRLTLQGKITKLKFFIFNQNR